MEGAIIFSFIVNLVFLIIGILMIVKFFQMAGDIRKLLGEVLAIKQEYYRMKALYKAGEYSNAKGVRAFAVGEELFSIEHDKGNKAIIKEVNKDGSYLCEVVIPDPYSPYYPKREKCTIEGDKLTDLPTEPAKSE